MTQDPVSFIEQLTNAWNSHDLEQVLPFYSEQYEGLDIGEPNLQHGREAVKQMLLRYWEAFPDLHFSVQRFVAEDQRIAVSWLAEGTHDGTILNIPSTGRRIEIRGVSIVDLKDGLVMRGEYMWDLAGMLRKIGLLPEL